MKGQAISSALLRAIGQWLACFPATLALASYAEFDRTWAWMAAVLVAALFGTGLSAAKSVKPWLFYLLLLLLLTAAVAGAIGALGVHGALPALYGGAVAWFGWRRFPPLAIPFTGIATNGVCLIAAIWDADLEPYRTLFIVSGAAWFVLAAYIGHAGLLDSAGLHDGIVTRLVLRSSRRYLTILVGVVLIVYLLTSDFHLWRTIARWVRELMPKGSSSPPEPSVMPEPAPALPPMLGEPSPRPEWAKWLDYAFYALAAAAILALLWLLVRRLSKDREWLQELAAKARRLLARLLRRRDPPPSPAYVDEKESMLDIGKTIRRAQTRWLRRSENKPIRRAEWERLGAAEKVRRLYRDAVLQAIEAGYKPKPSATPNETLDSVERWYESRSKERDAALAGWLRQTRALLGDLYGGARYGSAEASAAELERLAAEYPW
ncbi:hypothetical protein [Cohnella thailandensis]|uniref:DUF4129 domain-containing protein n=1 Tax=Cohnella thailandensis TaxID=557557 RepID=A0A841SZS5_9BACL|nr:hypothetical protein [Cohnella thailandensis]MBB6634291.1 hypothetical protein [Cohnella thailandensis]MBP1972211.1 hypothetical protein [Cohnella thailandensis]